MIKNPLALVAMLLAVEAAVLYVAGQDRLKKYFGFLPPVFWIYFVPMVLSTIGLIDAKSPVYQAITAYLLPASLVLLLISVDIRAILKLGRPALIMFFAGSAGVVFGAPIVFALFKPLIGPQFWGGFGALSASWTGGSANMVATKEALGTPDNVFLPMVIVDTIVPYVWMGILVAMAGAQPMFDRWNLSDRRILDQLSRKAAAVKTSSRKTVHWPMVGVIIALGAAGSGASHLIAAVLPTVKNVISTYAWTIIVVTALGVGLSFTPVKKLENFGSTRIGYWILYFVLTSIGAKANLGDLGSTLLLIVAGCVLVACHACVLLVTARIIRAPMFLVATASQANLGGVASAPVVAEIYQQGFGSVGLLLAILGNIVGTYFGIIAGTLCRLFS